MRPSQKTMFTLKAKAYKMFTRSVKLLSMKEFNQIFHGEDLSLVYKIYNATMCCRLLCAGEMIQQKGNNLLVRKTKQKSSQGFHSQDKTYNSKNIEQVLKLSINYNKSVENLTQIYLIIHISKQAFTPEYGSSMFVFILRMIQHGHPTLSI